MHHTCTCVHFVHTHMDYTSACNSLCMCVFSETHVSPHFNSTHSAVLVHLNNEQRLPSNMIRPPQCQMPAERLLELRMLSLYFT